MVGLDYTREARYIVSNGRMITVGRFNSLAKAKAQVSTMTEWHILDAKILASVASLDTKKSFASFIAEPEKYPTMTKCAKLFIRFKKSGKK